MPTLRIVMVAALVLAVGLLPTAQGKPRKQTKTTRTVTEEYALSAGVQAQGLNIAACVQDAGCLTFAVERGEQYVSLEITDASGTPTPFTVSFHDSTSLFCGQTNDSLWLNDAKEVAVTILGASADCQGIGTTGSLTATLSNKR